MRMGISAWAGSLRARALELAVSVTILALAALVAFYAVRVRHLELQLAHIADIELELNPGQRIGSLYGVDLAGHPATVAFGVDSRPTVLYVFTPTCIWCKRNLANLKSLMSAGSRRFRFVGISLAQDELLPRYLTSNHLQFPALIRDLPAGEIAQLRLGATPQTIVVSPAGVVAQDWRGAYVGPVEQAAARYFNLRFPGLVRVDTN